MTRRLPLIFILITLMIDAMGIGLILPVMPDLLQEVGGGDLGSAALWGGVLATSFAAMQFLFGPAMGNLSDRFGRRPILLISLLVMAADYLVMSVAGSIWVLLIARIIAGIAAATQSTAAAYIADISSPEEKAARFGLVSAAFGIGFILGPLIGGWLGEYGARMPFLAAAVLAGGNALFGFFVLPETVSDKRPFEWSRANPIGAFQQMRRLPGLAPLFLAAFLFEFAVTAYPVIWAYFTKAQFGWGPQMTGTTLGIYGISIVITQGLLIRAFLFYLGERATLFAGLCFSLISFILLGFVSNGTALLFMIPISALGFIVLPSIQGLMSKAAAGNQQGELQGALTSVRSLAIIFSPLVMTQVFAAATVEGDPLYLPGAPFLLSACLIVVCALVLCRQGCDFFVWRPGKRQDNEL